MKNKYLSLIKWLNMEDYIEEKNVNIRKIIRRFVRGNVKAQNGKIMTKKILIKRSKKADVIMKNLNGIYNK